jgi:hypothetical protein
MSEFGIWFAAIGMIISNIAGLVGVLKYFNSRFEKMYKDLDDYKKEADQNYVRKDLCKVMHEQSAINIVGLETRLTIRQDKLEGKMDEVISLLTKG